VKLTSYNSLSYTNYQQDLDKLLEECRAQRDNSENEAWDAWSVDYAFTDSHFAAIQEGAFRAGWKAAHGRP
jgi:hypothetical protein